MTTQANTITTTTAATAATAGASAAVAVAVAAATSVPAALAPIASAPPALVPIASAPTATTTTLRQTAATVRAGLSGNALKIIAIVAMTCDHLAWLIFPGFSTHPIALSMHVVGRLTAPIMMYFIAQGYYHTRDVKRYVARLLAFALLAQLPYSLLFGDTFTFPFGGLNVMWTFAMGLTALAIYKSDNPRLRPWMKQILVWACLFAAFPGDWSMPGAVAILYMGRNHGNFKRQMLFLMLWMACYALVYALAIDPLYGCLQLLVCLAIPLLACYNGQRGAFSSGTAGKVMKWLFYIYYPAHLLLLSLVKLLG
ncbi:MAG: conjugal transfer protein TraX [Coriobacteriales bacterium]|jgi:hypothetical protein|nr:conjugal transfer protein TraX [Coriobacteriales bacterium]